MTFFTFETEEKKCLYNLFGLIDAQNCIFFDLVWFSTLQIYSIYSMYVIFTLFKCGPLSTVISLYGLHLHNVLSILSFYMLAIDFDLVFAQTVSNRGVDFLRT